MKTYNPTVELVEVVVDEIYFGHVRWLWILRMRTIVMLQLVLFGTVPLVYHNSCVLRCANIWPIFDQTHGGYPHPIISSSPHLPQGYQDQRMVTCPHPLLDLSCQAIVCVGAKCNKWQVMIGGYRFKFFGYDTYTYIYMCIYIYIYIPICIFFK